MARPTNLHAVALGASLRATPALAPMSTTTAPAETSTDAASTSSPPTSPACSSLHNSRRFRPVGSMFLGVWVAAQGVNVGARIRPSGVYSLGSLLTLSARWSGTAPRNAGLGNFVGQTPPVCGMSNRRCRGRLGAGRAGVGGGALARLALDEPASSVVPAVLLRPAVVVPAVDGVGCLRQGRRVEAEHGVVGRVARRGRWVGCYQDCHDRWEAAIGEPAGSTCVRGHFSLLVKSSGSGSRDRRAGTSTAVTLLRVPPLALGTGPSGAWRGRRPQRQATTAGAGS